MQPYAHKQRNQHDWQASGNRVRYYWLKFYLTTLAGVCSGDDDLASMCMCGWLVNVGVKRTQSSSLAFIRDLGGGGGAGRAKGRRGSTLTAEGIISGRITDKFLKPAYACSAAIWRSLWSIFSFARVSLQCAKCFNIVSPLFQANCFTWTTCYNTNNRTSQVNKCVWG